MKKLKNFKILLVAAGLMGSLSFFNCYAMDKDFNFQEQRIDINKINEKEDVKKEEIDVDEKEDVLKFEEQESSNDVPDVLNKDLFNQYDYDQQQQNKLIGYQLENTENNLKEWRNKYIKIKNEFYEKEEANKKLKKDYDDLRVKYSDIVKKAGRKILAQKKELEKEKEARKNEKEQLNKAMKKLKEEYEIRFNDLNNNYEKLKEENKKLKEKLEEKINREYLNNKKFGERNKKNDYIKVDLEKLKNENFDNRSERIREEIANLKKEINK